MKRALRAACAAFLITLCGHAAQAADLHDLAPADEYFGQLRMSVLGIRNELASLERRALGGRGHSAALAGKLAMVDDALRDWHRHYPRDSWLPRFQAQRSRVAAMIGAGAALR